MKKKITNDYRTSELLEDKLQDHTDIAYKNSKIFPRTQHVNIVYEENDKIVAGLVGYNYLDYFHVGILWVDKDQRGKNLGSKLIKDLEKLKSQYYIKYIHLETMSFQALEFYLKLDFVVFGEIKDSDKTMFFLKKEI
ncbi:GNAT family N-acetyltransferase [Staphylococcus pseudoxylosus]|nr:GNAT family N-acetyltransferase [Staphylococcus pseudoxylosus]MEB6059546.1 GNAT family N-acetyltransferase [Staphylococcus pseudoxylosus]